FVSGKNRAFLGEGEPRRHHQVIGGKLEPQLARSLDERQVLISQRKDRNLREIHFLLTRENQQEIERTFEALHVNDHGWLGGAAIGTERRVEVFAAHDPIFRRNSVRSSSIICVNTLRAASVSNSSGALRAASATSARRAAAPVNSGASF